MIWPAQKITSRFSYLYWSNKTHGLHRNTDDVDFQKYADELLDMFQDRGTLIDVGCGSCQMTIHLASAFDRVFGVDFSESMLAKARKRIENGPAKNIQLLRGSAVDLPASIRQADVILSYAVVQYFSHEELILHLKECSRLLSLGGAVCIGLIPDARRRKVYYYEGLAPARLGAVGRLRSWSKLAWLRMVGWLRRDPIWDGIGNWYMREDIEAAAKYCGYSVEIRDCLYSDYRFHAVLRRKLD